MGGNKSGSAQKLMEVFLRFNRLNRNHSPVVGLRPSELHVLYCIRRKTASDDSGIKVSEISSILNVASPTVTQLVTSLETKGFVERGVDKEDRRAVRIKLTEEGEIIIKKASDDFFKSFNGLVEFLGEDKSRELTELLSKVFVYFDEMRRQGF